MPSFFMQQADHGAVQVRLRRSRIGFFVIFLTLYAASAVQAQPSRTLRDQAAFALIEYFTSTNCVHCVDAEDSLTALREDAERKGRNVHILAFHIDYLNNARERDPFSRLSFSERHFRYGEHFHSARAQAGEVIINGQFAASGKSPAGIERALYRALALPARTSVKLMHRYVPQSKTIQIDFTVKGLERVRREFYYLHTALVEDGVELLVHNAAAGEPRRLDNVVRALETTRFDGRSGEGTLQLVLGDNIVHAQARVVCFVQDPQNLHILGVSTFALVPATK